ncbi:proline-rich protein HaeIII subfamily 1-like [Physeter macrocephalus]|uniref:Proline-rich protein HaeIII subfamily 1-like n=1 Tax=Physeter macrocephalus TaxID=9755 RepID=A0A455C5V2_PHYMC|nr:proline-rich protein HaeIII subfamily 1-like [Physeter catodon]|eukprot:XP_028356715.1 proline-rich protein HaeIII subfamily 1-like [Physeter catodon]
MTFFLTSFMLAQMSLTTSPEGPFLRFRPKLQAPLWQPPRVRAELHRAAAPQARGLGGPGGRPGGPFPAGVRAGQPKRPRRPPPAASPAPSAPEGWLPKSLPLPALRLTSSGSRCSGDRAQRPVPKERTTLLGTHRHPCPLSRPLGISSGLRARTVSATPDQGAEGEAGRCPECPLPPDRLDLREGLAPQGGESRPSPVGTVALAVGGQCCEAPPPERASVLRGG